MDTSFVHMHSSRAPCQVQPTHILADHADMSTKWPASLCVKALDDTAKCDVTHGDSMVRHESSWLLMT